MSARLTSLLRRRVVYDHGFPVGAQVRYQPSPNTWPKFLRRGAAPLVSGVVVGHTAQRVRVDLLLSTGVHRDAFDPATLYLDSTGG